MKKIVLLGLLLLMGIVSGFAQAKIQFETYTHDFGTFNESQGVQKYTFVFTNTGDKPLVINQAIASCGCTVAEYTRTPVKPGEKGQVRVSYNGKNYMAGHFKKAVTIRTNGVPEKTRLYIEGVMETSDSKK